ncbi:MULTISPECIES: cytochrome P460 family protein [unclassified Leptolyngbya]|uniref:cytochrome P460 family protein n=1 Tax=unclassified Leptolyngbya TaxID=2650499 RepID=UPI00168923F2|nr:MULTISPECIES: cytochrome P460 family protein [unclassified Leptolyngbya]MBD1908983.1 cytochrome P460 family protein [Leptolyngbya sp. FACHB-8]MBD2158126.1 cytochrome P460 family protein [Leptolyngbya sp. FACHB-16]
MHKFLLVKCHWMKWMVLFLSTLVLAVILSQILNRSPSLSYRTNSSNQSSTESSPITNVTTDEVQVQSKYDRSLAHYATVPRNDGLFRQMFVNEEVIASIQPGKPLPDGTLIVMETWYSPENLGTVFVKQKQNGEWQYGSFSPDRPNYQMRFSNSCHSCHAPFPETDSTLTKPLLEAALQTRQVQTAYCDRAGRTPCAPEAYIPDTDTAMVFLN